MDNNFSFYSYIAKFMDFIRTFIDYIKLKFHAQVIQYASR